MGIVKSAATGSRYDNIKLTEEITARYVKINGTARTGAYGYSIWELGIYGPEEAKTIYHTVSMDGIEIQVEEGNTITLGEATYGYYCDGKMYQPGTEITVTSDMTFTSVNELSVTVAQGAGIRVEGDAGIRFRAAVTTDNETALSSDAITEGMLITANDIYENNGSALDINSTYTLKNIVNSGWYLDQTGTYCASIVNIAESNYIRNFIAKAYVTINYEDGTSTTVYSNMSNVRSIAQVAQNLISAGDLGNYTAEQQAIINAFAAAK